MTRAYNSMYLADAEDCLSCAFDYVVNACGLNGDRFGRLFVTTGYAQQFERGNPAVVAGMSGIELADHVLAEAGIAQYTGDAIRSLGASAEYWAGWALAQYQWEHGYTFEHLFTRLPFSQIVSLYNPYHEADITCFFDAADAIVAQVPPGETRLARIRASRGVSQRELSVATGVGLKSIQAYEQRTNNINKAQAGVLARLSWFLGCSIEDLLEFEPHVTVEYAG
ncbi:MAG: helix-turn-helix transcriptional regulator [Coriobacteriales bacterium]|nr:helix-turn-helix transcriptional regulator [Coriobacteriales bacterium]